MNKPKKKSALGRGLSVLLNNSDSYSVDINPTEEKIKVGVVAIPISQITTNPYQPRSNFSDENITELANSIKNLGIVQPITVRKIGDDKFQLIAGERRLRASKKIGLKAIPSFIKNSNDEEMLEIALVENIQRKDLDPIEIAISLKRLIDEVSLTQEQLSKKLGKKRSTISNYIRLLRLDPVIQTGIRDGFLSMGHGRSIINIEDKNVQLKIYKEIIKKEDNSLNEGVDGLDDINEFRLDEQTTSEENENQQSESVVQKKNLGVGDKDYKVFTTEFDEVAKAENLESPEEISKLRKNLDQQLTSFQDIITKLANKLQRQLLAKQNRAWEFDLEEGLLDSSKLPRIIIDPYNSLSFKKEKDLDFKDTVVTLLIDNSGSMRGRPITIAALCADILSRTLERCSVKVEILGFTTKNWKGGLSREEWNKSGKTKNPGRLNDLRHIIYKSADTHWRQSKKNLGLMLKEGLLKENIDGEAITWAFNRLKKRKEERKIMMVISDGAPVDDSTLSVNSGDFLEKHLKKIVKFIENKSDIEILAIGIGHDVSRYYQKAIKITDVQELGDVMIGQLSGLFENKKKLH